MDPNAAIESRPTRDDDTATDDAQQETGSRLVRREYRREEWWAGPLPHPEILRQYDEVIPGSGKDIVGMAKSQGEHRRHLEQELVASQTSDVRAERAEARLGQVFAFIIALLGLMLGAYCINKGHPVAGSVLGGSPIVTVVTAFIWGRTKRSEVHLKEETLDEESHEASPETPADPGES